MNAVIRMPRAQLEEILEAGLFAQVVSHFREVLLKLPSEQLPAGEPKAKRSLCHKGTLEPID